MSQTHQESNKERENHKETVLCKIKCLTNHNHRTKIVTTGVCYYCLDMIRDYLDYLEEEESYSE